MIRRRFLAFSFLLFLVLPGCKNNDPAKTTLKLQLSAARVGTTAISLSVPITSDLPVNQPIVISFSSPLDITSVPSAITVKNSTQIVEVNFSYLDNNKSVSILPKQPLSNNTLYTVAITNRITGAANEIFPGFTFDFKTIAGQLSILSYKVGGQLITTNNRIINVPLSLSFEIDFSSPLDVTSITPATVNIAGPDNSTLVIAYSTDKKTMTITRAASLVYFSKYTINASAGIKGASGEVFGGFSQDFYTGLGGHTSGLAAKTDNELLDLIQLQTFKYFWDSGYPAGSHPASGMARERNTSGNTVTTGGSGFGIMAIIVGSERNFITKSQAVTRLNKIVGFLETAQRFHGAWAHWMDGNSGKVIPFSTNDNGGDLVETSFLMEGLITFRQYLASSSSVTTDTSGNNLINRITQLYQTVEWDWYRRCEPNCQNVLYWHWSPDKGWIMNFPLYGYFEEQITYVLAAASPTHSIPKIVYANGYGLNGSIVKGNTFTFGGESHVLPLADPAPLFWVQYSYLGLDPHFTDDYADYWIQNTNASLINHAYCKANPDFYAGYSNSCWGLTASDNPDGYGAQSVGNDNGTITPTAALSSFPYTPVESMKALRFFYDIIGDRIWDPDYGPHDAFNITDGWYADSYLAIDQGTIPVMIENYRSNGSLWNLFMSAPEIQTAKTNLGFH